MWYVMGEKPRPVRSIKDFLSRFISCTYSAFYHRCCTCSLSWKRNYLFAGMSAYFSDCDYVCVGVWRGFQLGGV